MKPLLGFRSKKEGKNIPQEIMLEFEEDERRFKESNGKRNPYEILWDLARNHAGLDGKNESGKQSAEDIQLDKLPSGRQDIQSGNAESFGDNVPMPSGSSKNAGNIKAPRRTFFARLFHKK